MLSSNKGQTFLSVRNEPENMEEASQIKKLSALLEISKALGSTLNIREAVENDLSNASVLEAIVGSFGGRRFAAVSGASRGFVEGW